MRIAPFMLLGLAVGGCTTTQRVAPIAPPPPQSTIGLEQVLGQSPPAVVKLIGSPGLDRTEGKGRHLQFAQGSCVLDVYFYAPPGGGEPVATYADARLKDGKPLDTASCLQIQLRATPQPLS